MNGHLDVRYDSYGSSGSTEPLGGIAIIIMVMVGYLLYKIL